MIPSCLIGVTVWAEWHMVFKQNNGKHYRYTQISNQHNNTIEVIHNVYIYIYIYIYI